MCTFAPVTSTACARSGKPPAKSRLPTTGASTGSANKSGSLTRQPNLRRRKLSLPRKKVKRAKPPKARRKERNPNQRREPPTWTLQMPLLTCQRTTSQTRTGNHNKMVRQKRAEVFASTVKSSQTQTKIKTRRECRLSFTKSCRQLKRLRLLRRLLMMRSD